MGNFSTLQIGAVLCVAVIAGLARGFSGFGAALIFMPVASAAIGPKLAAPVLLMTDLVMSAGMIPPAYKIANRRDAGLMAVGALIGIPAGTFLLASANPIALRWAIVALVVAFLMLLLSGWRYAGKPAGSLTLRVGAISGLFSGAAQVGGPPVVAYWMGGTLLKDLVRANIVLFFAFSSIISLVSYLGGGLIGMTALGFAALAGPLYGLGLYGGSHLHGMASERAFRMICLGLIGLAAVLGLPLLDPLLGR